MYINQQVIKMVLRSINLLWKIDKAKHKRLRLNKSCLKSITYNFKLHKKMLTHAVLTVSEFECILR